MVLVGRQSLALYQIDPRRRGPSKRPVSIPVHDRSSAQTGRIGQDRVARFMFEDKMAAGRLKNGLNICTFDRYKVSEILDGTSTPSTARFVVGRLRCQVAVLVQLYLTTLLVIGSHLATLDWPIIYSRTLFCDARIDAFQSKNTRPLQCRSTLCRSPLPRPCSATALVRSLHVRCSLTVQM